MPERAPQEPERLGEVDVTLEVPRILCDTTGGRREVALRALTIESALQRMRVQWPILAALVLDDAGAVRQHVLILHNGKLTRYLRTLDVPLREGDRLQIVQAVSGG